MPYKNAKVQEVLTFLQENDHPQAAKTIRDLIDSTAALENRWADIAKLSMVLGEYKLATQAAKLFASTMNYQPSAMVYYASLCAECGNAATAIKILGSFSPTADLQNQVYHMTGTLYAQLGQFDRAKKYYEKTLNQFPLSGMTWMALAETINFSKHSKHYEKICSLEKSMHQTSPENYSAYLYALGKASHDTANYKQASKYYVQGAELIKLARPYDYSADQIFSDYMIKQPTFIPISSPDNHDNLIFILGKPRSGTTLLEQQLLSHSTVTGGGEVNLFITALHPDIHTVLTARKNLDTVSDEAWQKTREQYLHLVNQRFEKPTIFVDKTLNNTQLFPLLIRTFPNAKYVNINRDAQDTALSCFTTFFARGLNWSWSLKSIARYFQLQDRYDKAWSTQYPHYIHRVQYEGMVSNVEQFQTALYEYCQLTTETASPTSHQTTSQLITTASLKQVRQPITRSAIGKASKYPALMKTFDEFYSD